MGAPKAGTTSLYRYLRQHPQIFMSPVKEPNYFASEVRPERFAEPYRLRAQKAVENLRQRLRQPLRGGPYPEGIVAEWDDYIELFRGGSGADAVGEASVCYLWSASAPANIRAAIPEARIIMILRDPAERAFSQYLHNARDGIVTSSFREQIELAAGEKREEFQPLYPFLENGFYFEQVRRFLDRFPREHVRIFIYEQAWRDPARFLKEVFEFLNVDSRTGVDLSKRELPQRAPRSMVANQLLNRSGAGPALRKLIPLPIRTKARSVLFKKAGSVKMNASDRQVLREYYRDDVQNLAKLLGRDLHQWLD